MISTFQVDDSIVSYENKGKAITMHVLNPDFERVYAVENAFTIHKGTATKYHKALRATNKAKGYTFYPDHSTTL